MPRHAPTCAIRAAQSACLISAAALVLAACGSSPPEPTVQVKAEVVRCPPERVEIECPPIPPLAGEVSLEQVEDWWVDVRPALVCRDATIAAWEAGWEACGIDAE